MSVSVVVKEVGEERKNELDVDPSALRSLSTTISPNRNVSLKQ